ncbi:hypothetical protein NECAME_12794 [Necator americanus]|uniref:Uncharacterized protein n=1 Tax=Necator americanus TaxID=51031 RepID=W2SYI7_NECAM|nr:hypothetical protein NECAME_12794 [Necator americanus]ETN74705.1 hypothetical protein NECAME_12794 [Necator americanus]
MEFRRREKENRNCPPTRESGSHSLGLQIYTLETPHFRVVCQKEVEVGPGRSLHPSATHLAFRQNCPEKN